MIIFFSSPRVEKLGMYVQQWGKTFCLFNLNNCARITFKHSQLGHFAILTWILNYCSQQNKVGKCQHFGLIRRQIICEKSFFFKKFSSKQFFFEDKGQFASQGWNFLCQGYVCHCRGLKASKSHSLPRTAEEQKRYGWYNTLFYCSCIMARYMVTDLFHIYILVIKNSAADSRIFVTEGF